MFLENYVSESNYVKANVVEMGSAGGTNDLRLRNLTDIGKQANEIVMRSDGAKNELLLKNYQRSNSDVVNGSIEIRDTITYVCQNWHDFQFKGDDRRFRVGGYDGFSGDVTVKDWSGTKHVKLVFHYGIITGWYYVS